MKYKITIEFESSELVDEDLNMECDTLRNEFLESELYNLENLKVNWEKIK
jgi:hypothetical protein